MVKRYSDHKHLTLFLRSLPDRPGVYLYFDSDDVIIYIGKAKNLKKRVRSYFQKERFEQGKLAVLVRKIARIEHVVVNNELDALLLENNLIKEHRPKYNIQLKDDKTFPWICIKNEPFPRVFSTRNTVKDGSEYYGPYASVRMMNNILDLIRQLYRIRSCTLKLTPEHIASGRYKVCLEYHIKNCNAPCVGYETETEYNNTIHDIRQIIKGNITHIIKKLRTMMHEYAGTMQFELAQSLKERLELLEKFRGKSIVVNPKIKDCDTFSFRYDNDTGYVNYLKVVDGAVIQSHTVELKKKLDETDEELLYFAITTLRQRFNSSAKDIVIPFAIDYPDDTIKIHVPQRGDKKELLGLSEQNLKYYLIEKRKREALVDPERHTMRIMDVMKRELRLKEEPRHIECFDNSNLQGTEAVAAMVVFRDGKPVKNEYRHYTIKTVEGPDDYASMEEVIYRRYKRLQEEKQPLPQLVIVDGGKGQLSSALKSLEKLNLRGTISIIGIAKKLEEIYFPGDSYPLHLDKRSETLRVIQHARNEAHRFGIAHHRQKREKNVTQTQLTAIDGIGYNTAQKLLWKFRSVKRISEAPMEELVPVVGKAKARLVFHYFKK